MSEAAKSLRQSEAQEPVLKQDWARRDGLPGDIEAPESLGELRRETVLLIHGTFANNAASAPWWWRPGSEFCRKLDLSLSQQGSPARCWTHIGPRENVFAWRGDNLETERRIGGDSLAKAITDLEAGPDISRYHIVAHSHGGNVVLLALRALTLDPKKLGAVIFLGTPVLWFLRLPQWLNGSAVAMLFYGAGLVYFLDGALLVKDFATIILAMSFGLMLLIEWLTRPRSRLSIYGAGYAHAFEFADDEAMKTLQLSLEFGRQPGTILNQLFSTKEHREYAVEPQRPDLWKYFWPDFKKTAAYRLFDAVRHPWRSLTRPPTPRDPISSRFNSSLPRPAGRKKAIAHLVQLTRSKNAAPMLVSIIFLLIAITLYARMVHDGVPAFDLPGRTYFQLVDLYSFPVFAMSLFITIII